MGRPGRRGRLRDPDRAGRRLVLQAEPGRAAASDRSQTVASEALPGGAEPVGGSSSWTSPATASSTWWLSPARRRASTSAPSTRTGSRSAPSASCPTSHWDDPNLRFVDLDGDGHADVLITEHDVFTWYPSLAEEGFGPAQTRPPAAGRGARPAAGLRRRHAVHLPRRHVRRRPHRPRAHPQRRGLLLAEPGLRPLRRQGHHGQRALVRPPRSVRPAPHPPGRHRRLGHQRHHLPAPRRRAPLLQPVGQPLERGAPPGPVPARRQRLVGHDGRPAGQRHRLPGLVVAAARRCAPAAALHRPDGRDRSRTCWSSRVNNLGAETRGSLRALDPVLPGRTSATAGPGSPGCRSPCMSSSASSPTTASAATASSPATPTTTATSTASSASSAASAWWSSGTPRSSPRSAPADRRPPAPTSTPSSHVPPVLTKTWFHTGVYLGRDHVSDFFAGLLDANDVGEYYREPGLSDAQARALLLDDTVLPEGLTVEEEREACRALKGSMLRQEVYAQDGTDEARAPLHRHRAELHDPDAAAAGQQSPRRLLHPCPGVDQLPLRAQAGRSAHRPRADAGGGRLTATSSSPPPSATGDGSRTRTCPPRTRPSRRRSSSPTPRTASPMRSRRPTITARRCPASRAPTS